jgi:hypothetical protein
VACAACSEELLRQEAFDRPEAVPAARLAAAWERFEAREAQPGKRAAVRWRLAARPALALAASLAAVALGLGVWLVIGWSPAGEGPEGESLRGAEAEGFTPSGALTAPPAEFHFPAADAGPRRVLVFDAEGTYRWTSEPATGGRVGFPETERQKLRPGVDYSWTVLDGGAAEPTISFRVEPR